MTDLKGQVGIVTGGAQGIGLGIARKLAAAGVTVVLADINGDKAAASAKALGAKGNTASSCGVNVGVQKEVAAMVEQTLDQHGRIDILVNNAGGSGHAALATIEETDETVWDSVITANLRGTYLCVRAVIPHMKARGSGRIVNTSSVVARGFGGGVGTVGARLPYVAAKAGIEAFTRQMAHDVHMFGITVNCVVPGMIMTEPGARMHERFSTLPAADQARVLQAFNGEFATPDEVGELVTYLASAGARHVNGQSIPVGFVG